METEKVAGQNFFFLHGGGDVLTSASASSRLSLHSASSRLSMVTSRARALYFSGCCVTWCLAVERKTKQMSYEA